MPAISIQLDLVQLAMINLEGMEVVDVSVHGALERHPKATLDAHGGNYSEGGCGQLIWVAEQPLQQGQVLKVTLIESCDAWDQGKTIDELFPDEEPCTQTDFTISEEMAAEIRARPNLHEAFSVHVKTSHGQRAETVSDPLNSNFSFSVMWNFTQPTQVRVRLNTHCLDDVVARKAGTNHLTATLTFGDSATFTLLA
jgi:hypothetical protein